MIWETVFLILLCLVVGTAAYCVGYALVFVYLFLCEARRSGNHCVIARKVFKPIAVYVLEVRRQIDPENLRVIDQRMLRNTPLMVLLTGSVLVFLGWLAVTAFRHLIS